MKANTKPTLYTMIGIMGSGKSTFAKQFADRENMSIHSSDEIRLELFGTYDCMDKHDFVFAELYKRVKEDLLQGKDVIVDACSLTLKSRRKLFNGIGLDKSKYTSYALVIATPMRLCLDRNNSRDRKVPTDVIFNARKSFQFPMNYEFDEVRVFVQNEEWFPQTIESILECTKNFNQDNPHHELTLGEHMKKCGDFLKENHSKKPYLSMCGYLHDLGKLYCKKFDENGVARYFGHESISAYESIFILDAEAREHRSKWFDCIRLINYHMLPYDWKTEETTNKYHTLFGDEFFTELMALHRADREAH